MVACTFGRFPSKIMRRYTLFSVQITDHQVDQIHKLMVLSVKFDITSKIDLSRFLLMV